MSFSQVAPPGSELQQMVDFSSPSVVTETTVVHDFGGPQSDDLLWTCAVSAPEVGLIAVNRQNQGIAVYRYCPSLEPPATPLNRSRSVSRVQDLVAQAANHGSNAAAKIVGGGTTISGGSTSSSSSRPSSMVSRTKLEQTKTAVLRFEQTEDDFVAGLPPTSTSRTLTRESSGKKRSNGGGFFGRFGGGQTKSSNEGSSTSSKKEDVAGFQFYCSIDLSQEASRTVRSLDFCPSTLPNGGVLLACATFDAVTVVLKHLPKGPTLLAAGSGANPGTLQKPAPRTSIYEDCEVVPSMPHSCPPWTVYTRLLSHDNEVKCVRFSPFGSYVATSGRDKAIYIYRAGDPDECLAHFADHTGDVKFLTWRPNREDELISCSFDATIRVFRSLPNQPDDWFLVDTLESEQFSPISLLRGPLSVSPTYQQDAALNNIVWSLAYKPDGKAFASGGQDGRVLFWREVADSSDEKWTAKQPLAGSSPMEDVATDLMLMGPFTGLAQVTSGAFSPAERIAPTSKKASARREQDDSPYMERARRMIAEAEAARKQELQLGDDGGGAIDHRLQPITGGGSSSSSSSSTTRSIWQKMKTVGSTITTLGSAGSKFFDKRAENQHETSTGSQDIERRKDLETPLTSRWVADFAIDGLHEHSIYSLSWIRTLDGSNVLCTGCGDNMIRFFLLDSNDEVAFGDVHLHGAGNGKGNKLLGSNCTKAVVAEQSFTQANVAQQDWDHKWSDRLHYKPLRDRVQTVSTQILVITGASTSPISGARRALHQIQEEENEAAAQHIGNGSSLVQNVGNGVLQNGSGHEQEHNKAPTAALSSRRTRSPLRGHRYRLLHEMNQHMNDVHCVNACENWNGHRYLFSVGEDGRFLVSEWDMKNGS
ncbi:unnamed protein product [Amoebophrya sp. A25]|nr:unnamed protein product [Amoebophrya sp. A25]|eukprot:GSA25T00018357001.1